RTGNRPALSQPASCRPVMRRIRRTSSRWYRSTGTLDFELSSRVTRHYAKPELEIASPKSAPIVENQVPLVIAVIAGIARHRRERVMALGALWPCGAERQVTGDEGVGRLARRARLQQAR